MPNPHMAPTSDDDLVTMAALGDEDAKKQLAERSAQMSKGTDPKDDTPAKPTYTMEELAKAQAAGASPPAPPVKQTPEQAKADGGQQEPGNAVLSKADDEDDEDDEDEMEKKCKKSMDEVSPDEEALNKAIDIAEGIARGATADPDPDRREVLAKAYADGTIDDEGRSELLNLLKSEVPADDDDIDDDIDDDTLSKGYTQAALEDPAIEAGHVDEDGIDVSGFLGRLSAFVGGSLDAINNDLSKSNNDLSKSLDRVHQYNLASAKANRQLAKMVIRQEKMIKSLARKNGLLEDRLEQVETQPTPRRTAPTAQALQKSMTGADGQPMDGAAALSKDEMTKGFTMLLHKSMQEGYAGERFHAPCGRDITTDTAHYESHNQVHPDMLSDIKNVLGKK